MKLTIFLVILVSIAIYHIHATYIIYNKCKNKKLKSSRKKIEQSIIDMESQNKELEQWIYDIEIEQINVIYHDTLQ
jgi:cell division protein FtsL